MLAAGCAAKCPPHAIAAVAGALVAGFVIGRLTKRCKCSGRKHSCDGANRRDRKPVPRMDSARQPVPAGSVEIYVGNLSYELTEDQLRKEFEKFGTVGSARIVTDKNGQRSKGFGFVVMPNRPEAENAIAAMSEKEFMGRKMRVNEARNTIKEDA